MTTPGGSEFSRGSEWRRWDPHLHAPGTLLSDQFGGDWNAYLHHLETVSPPVQALGVTDYFCIRTYEAVLAWQAKGRLASVGLIFPNVEMRLDIKTEKKKPINIHLLFSPDDPDHPTQIIRILGHLKFEFKNRTYRCTLAELAELGRAFDTNQTDEEGALRVGVNQFKVTLQDLKDLFRSEAWLRSNSLVAISGNLSDGTSGLQEDDSFSATRREIESFAHIIFASSTNQRDFWLGKKPNADRRFIEQTYGFIKPCLHGSDAHRDSKVLTPDLDRYCWIKGDLTFESLRQAVLEPEERVWIGTAPPAHKIPPAYISQMQTSGTLWLKNDTIQLNPCLVAIIGARGSGKTALAEILAAGSQALGTTLAESSFLRRASSPMNHLAGARVDLQWNDGTKTFSLLTPSQRGSEEDEFQGCRYLSQHFVDQLCSAAGLATELRQEIERVVFEATDPTERLEASSFQELVDILLEPARRRRSELQNTILSASQLIVQEDALRSQLPKLQKDFEALKKQIIEERKLLQSLFPKGSKERADRLLELERACTNAEARVEQLFRRRQAIQALSHEVAQIRDHIEPARLTDMRRRHASASITEAEWSAFAMNFAGEVDTILKNSLSFVDSALTLAREGDSKVRVGLTTIPLSDWPLLSLRATRDDAKNAVGIDAQQQKKYDDLRRTIATRESAMKRLETEITNAKGAESRRSDLIASRRAAYVDVIGTYFEEETTLTQLYDPLKGQLTGASGALAKLQFVIRRRVDIDTWVKEGEQLIDLRKESRFRGHGMLRKAAEQYLLHAWSKGTAQDVAEAMELFRSEYTKDLIEGMPGSVSAEEKPTWIQAVAAWLYGTNHIRIEYGIEYDGVVIEQLSPGTRGIVLLLLYLALDRQDGRPLIIDQPEENLDPNSVFEELVPQFREARTRRQVIIVTHNANLVVNTDAEQIIVAKSTPSTSGTLPTIVYTSGAIENPQIRNQICEILEGGEIAFLERERRYRLSSGGRV